MASALVTPLRSRPSEAPPASTRNRQHSDGRAANHCPSVYQLMKFLTGILNGDKFTPICGPAERYLAHRTAFKNAVGPGEVVIFQGIKKRQLVAQTPPDRVITPVADKTFGKVKAR